MKKTIRKKIMRDLQQAFVGSAENDAIESQKLPENVQSLNFDPKKAAGRNDEKLLDMLKREGSPESDSGIGHSDNSDRDNRPKRGQ